MNLQVSDQRGFTLLEMMIAVFVLAVGLLGLAQLQITAIRTNTQADTIASATALAQSALEQINTMDGDNPLFQTPELSNAQPVDLTSLTSGTPYELFVSTDVDWNGMPNVTKVDVTVQSINVITDITGTSKRAVTLTALKRSF
jgi:type IV pilus assembly protein PilV